MEKVEELLRKQRIELGKRLKLLRGNNTTQKEMAELLGIGTSAYSAKERGEEGSGLTTDQMQTLIDKFGITYYWLMTGVEQPDLPTEIDEKEFYKQLYERANEENKFLKQQINARNEEISSLLQVMKGLSKNG